MEKMSRNVYHAKLDAVKDGKILVYVEADHYMAEGGKGYWLKITVSNKK